MDEYGWELWWKVERDICYLYHELSEFAAITGDLTYSSLYSLPYWEFLHLEDPSMSEQERCFIRDGCLVMILAMSWDMIDGSGWYLRDKVDLCRQAISELQTEDERTEKLRRVVLMALDSAELRDRNRKSSWEERKIEELRELEQLSIWVNNEYVRGYFRRMADESQITHVRADVARSATTD